MFLFVFFFYLGEGPLLLSRQLSAEPIISFMGITMRFSFTINKLNKEEDKVEWDSKKQID